MIRVIYLIHLFVFFGYVLKGSHIVGGTMTYECLGNGDYKVQLKIYKDCSCKNCPAMDNVANIGIFICNDFENCGNLAQKNVFKNFAVNLKSIKNLPPSEDVCISENAKNICIEEGLYEFKFSDFKFSLPSSKEYFVISYQRCCRTENVSNLANASSLGGTFYVVISPDSQKNCNSSPVIQNVPPISTSINSALNISVKAIDRDSDLLIYEFCSPLQGGGLLEGSLSSSCFGTSPNPSCPPPFDPVVYVNEEYDFLNPLGKKSKLKINPLNGTITGTPTLLGQFSVGICVSEYRNGKFLGKIRRDFDLFVNSVPQGPMIPRLNLFDSIVCEGDEVIFNVFPDSKVDNYIWEIPNGWVGESSGSLIKVKVGNQSGNILVKASNKCGPSEVLETFVEVIPNKINSNISGSSLVTANSSYIYSIIPQKNILKYFWIIPDDWTGFSDSSSIKVITSDKEGIIQVYAISTCGITEPILLKVKIIEKENIYYDNSSIVATGGFFHNFDGLNLDYSVGLIDYISIGTKIFLTEGIQQPNGIIISVEEKSPSIIINIKPINLKSAEIFPNPTSGNLFLKIDNISIDEKLQISIFDLNGKLLNEMKLAQNMTFLDLTQFPSGTYFLKIKSSESFYGPFKIIKYD